MVSPYLPRRSPPGERGLKFDGIRQLVDHLQSLPSRGAWIEIGNGAEVVRMTVRRSPPGERGLKW